MEYLMTYGWAILIIAVVLTVLFQLGIFSGGNFRPHAQAGACQVSRTAAGISLEGQCNGLLPQFVIVSPVSSGCVGGPSVPMRVSQMTQTSLSAVTISWWGTYSSISGVFLHLDSAQVDPGGNGIYCSLSNCNIPNTYVYGPSGITIQTNTWYFSTLVLSSSGTATMYVNGAPGTPVSWLSGSGLTGITDLDVLGYLPGCEDWAQGSAANIQVYNTSLSSSEVSALYLEGIGGAPIRPQNLVGWWPLNGNANDYSGNDNNGATINVIYSSSWESGYTAP